MKMTEYGMELEEARDILANCIDDYVISSYCNNTCDEEVDCKNEDCIFHQAIEVVLNHITKQEKMIQKIHENFCKFDWKNSNGEEVHNQLKELYESI